MAKKEKLKYDFLEKDWHTPNTYDINYKDVPTTSGVYMLVWVDFKILDYVSIPNREILYIGSAKNLANRYKGHLVLRLLKKTHGYIQFHFQECENYYAREKELIKNFHPIFNIQHNG